MQVLGHLSGRDKGISWCRKVDGGVKAEMAQILGDIVGKKATDGKRKSEAAAATSSIVSSAAALAAAKRSCPSSSSGPDVGAEGIASAFAKQGEMGRDSMASMTIADMIIREGLPGDFALKPKVIAAFEAYKLTSKNFKSPGTFTRHRGGSTTILRTLAPT